MDKIVDPKLRERCRLASDTSTTPDVLTTLAQDQDVEIRAAVAMNPAAPQAADETLAADPDERIRVLIGRKLAAMMPRVSEQTHDRACARVMTMLGQLVCDEATRIRAVIADILKEMPQAPHDVILRLASDDVFAVSGPVIKLSPLLTEEDLIGLLATAQPDQAAAIASRPGLPSGVCDVIAAGFDAETIRALLENGSAAIREATLDRIAARATCQTSWHGPLVRRPVLSGRAARHLAGFVRDDLLRVLADRTDLAPDVLADLRTRLDARLHYQTGSAARGHGDESALLDEARALAARGDLVEHALLAAAAHGDDRRALAMLAVAADVPIGVARHAAKLQSGKGVVSLVWKAGFSMRLAVALQSLVAHLSPAALLRPNARGGFPLEADEMRWQIVFLSQTAACVWR
jgi:uncharacterized protein (DUF2336 family)